MSDGGKGCSPRPILIDQEQYKEKWNAVFGEKPVLKGYCNICNKKESWCKCWENGTLGQSLEHAKPASKEQCEEIDKALGIKRRKK